VVGGPWRVDGDMRRQVARHDCLALFPSLFDADAPGTTGAADPAASLASKQLTFAWAYDANAGARRRRSGAAATAEPDVTAISAAAVATKAPNRGSII
jgi:hypothetical protein